MRTAEEEREYQRKKKAAQRARHSSKIDDKTAAVLNSIQGPKGARPPGSGWLDSPRFLEALVSLDPVRRHDAALRIKQLTRHHPMTVETAIGLSKPPHDNTAEWIIRQSHLRAYRGRIAAHRAISIQEATAVAQKIPTDELPDLLDAALAAVQAHLHGIGSMRVAVLDRAMRVQSRTRRDAAMRWREHGAGAPAKHGRKANIIRVSLDKLLQAYADGETSEPLHAFSADMDGSATFADNPYGTPYNRERRKAGTYKDVYSLKTETG